MGDAVNRGRFTTGWMVMFSIIVLNLVVGVGGSAWAEDVIDEDATQETSSVLESDNLADKPKAAAEKSAAFDVRGDEFVNTEVGFRLERAGGWLVGVPSQGAVAVFRAAGESQAQIEFRVSENIDEASRGDYVSAFHNSLLRVGFVELGMREKSNYGGRLGTEYEYRVLSDGREFRLIAWLYARESTMWIVTGFFPLSMRDAYFRGYQTMLRSLEFTDSGTE